jgi:hypothetical protein
MPNVFRFNPADYAPQFADRGFVYVQRGLTDEYLAVLTGQIAAFLESSRLKEWAIGNKQQSLYEFPAEGNCFEELLQTIAAVCGLDARQLVLSERHIKAYEADAKPNPLAHKDRYASEVSVGFSVTVPAGSKLVLYPNDEVSVNPYNTAARLRAGLRPERVPETALKNARRIEIQDAPGDVVIFRGNALWHMRENGAGTTNLYLKLNTFNCDPLGEDPRSERVRQQTLRAVQAGDAELELLVPCIGRRVDYVHRLYTRQWDEVAEAVLWGDQPIALNEAEMCALKLLDGDCNVRSVIHGMSHAGHRDGLAAVRRLAAAGAIDLFPAD